MKRRLWPLLALLSIAACGDDDPVGPDGPPLRTITTESWNYLDNRFFRLDLPPADAEGQGYDRSDNPGRAPGERIDVTSIRIVRYVVGGEAQPGDVQHIAVTTDTSGRWTDLPAAEAWTARVGWRPVAFDLSLSDSGSLIAVDLRQEMESSDLLGVVYDVVDADGQAVYHVGDNPWRGDPPGLDIDGVPHYSMKLLKPTTRDPFTFQYVLRNVYYLGAANIQTCDFDLVIERNTDEADADRETNGLPYLRIFGLDRHDPEGGGGPDGIVDENDAQLFDLARGLLRFPLDFPRPFAATAAEYADRGGRHAGGIRLGRNPPLATPDAGDLRSLHSCLAVRELRHLPPGRDRRPRLRLTDGRVTAGHDLSRAWELCPRVWDVHHYLA